MSYSSRWILVLWYFVLIQSSNSSELEILPFWRKPKFPAPMNVLLLLVPNMYYQFSDAGGTVSRFCNLVINASSLTWFSDILCLINVETAVESEITFDVCFFGRARTCEAIAGAEICANLRSNCRCGDFFAVPLDEWMNGGRTSGTIRLDLRIAVRNFLNGWGRISSTVPRAPSTKRAAVFNVWNPNYSAAQTVTIHDLRERNRVENLGIDLPLVCCFPDPVSFSFRQLHSINIRQGLVVFLFPGLKYPWLIDSMETQLELQGNISHGNFKETFHMDTFTHRHSIGLLKVYVYIFALLLRGVLERLYLDQWERGGIWKLSYYIQWGRDTWRISSSR